MNDLKRDSLSLALLRAPSGVHPLSYSKREYRAKMKPIKPGQKQAWVQFVLIDDKKKIVSYLYELLLDRPDTPGLWIIDCSAKVIGPGLYQFEISSGGKVYRHETRGGVPATAPAESYRQDEGLEMKSSKRKLIIVVIAVLTVVLALIALVFVLLKPIEQINRSDNSSPLESPTPLKTKEKMAPEAVLNNTDKSGDVAASNLLKSNPLMGISNANSINANMASEVSEIQKESTFDENTNENLSQSLKSNNWANEPLEMETVELEGRLYYKVKMNDTLNKISLRLYGAEGLWQEAASINDIDDPDKIYIGEEFLFPVEP